MLQEKERRRSERALEERQQNFDGELQMKRGRETGVDEQSGRNGPEAEGVQDKGGAPEETSHLRERSINLCYLEKSLIL